MVFSTYFRCYPASKNCTPLQNTTVPIRFISPSVSEIKQKVKAKWISIFESKQKKSYNSPIALSICLRFFPKMFRMLEEPMMFNWDMIKCPSGNMYPPRSFFFFPSSKENQKFLKFFFFKTLDQFHVKVLTRLTLTFQTTNKHQLPRK